MSYRKHFTISDDLIAKYPDAASFLISDQQKRGRLEIMMFALQQLFNEIGYIPDSYQATKAIIEVKSREVNNNIQKMNTGIKPTPSFKPAAKKNTGAKSKKSKVPNSPPASNQPSVPNQNMISTPVQNMEQQFTQPAGYQPQVQQPVYQQPVQQPVYQQPAQQMVQQPAYQQPVQQPIQQPIYQQPVQQMPGQPMQQMNEQQMQQPGSNGEGYIPTIDPNLAGLLDLDD